MNLNPFRQAAADTMSAAACGVRVLEQPSPRGVDADKKDPPYEALDITVSYQHEKRTATVRSRPSSAYRQWWWVVHEIP